MFLAVLALCALSACVRLVPGGATSTPAAPRPAVPQAGASISGMNLVRGPAVNRLELSAAGALRALSSFKESCPRLLSRADSSKLTSTDDWRRACGQATNWNPGRAKDFFDTHFETARISGGDAFVTGYFEPEIAGSRTRRPGYDVPVYQVPSDLQRGWPDGTPAAERTGRAPLGRQDESGRFVPYYDRAAIENGALAGQGLEIAWAADSVEFFFLQIQGSGRLRTPEGDVIRIGYAGQNGHSYTAIGALMRERGLVGTGPGQYAGTMQGIMRYVRDNPAAGRALMQENRSWVFFRELTGDGPIGALGVPVRPMASVAADPAFVPLGAPIWLDTDDARAKGLWIAQDTGGAIKGANRYDTFQGAGEAARSAAGAMQARGQALILLPKGTLQRHGVK